MPAPSVVPWDVVFIVMTAADNVGVARRHLPAGTTIDLDGTPFVLAAAIGTGHKVARRAIAAGERVIRWGAPIGSAIDAIPPGAHVHLHNMRSDYIATYLAGDTTHAGTEDKT